MIYLASPYSYKSDDPEEVKAKELERFNAVVAATAKLFMRGVLAFSPIVHSHPQYVAFPETGKYWENWAEIDRQFIDLLDEVWVVMIPGWEFSKGIAAEVNYAESLGKPVRYINEEGEFE